MATVNYTEKNLDRRTTMVTWTPLGNADTGAPYELPRYQDKTMHVFGTFGSATAIMQGSNDPRVLADYQAGTTTASWFTLVDPQGNTVSKTADAGEIILENPRFIRPSTSGGTGTAVSVIVACTRAA